MVKSYTLTVSFNRYQLLKLAQRNNYRRSHNRHLAFTYPFKVELYNRKTYRKIPLVKWIRLFRGRLY